MKIISALLSSLIICTPAFADRYVSGHVRSNGTYVQGRTQSSPDAYRYNNRGSETRGGSQRDELSSGSGATNRANPSYGSRDNDNDGVPNALDRAPNSKRGGW